MIARLWHGYTTPENADAYQDVLVNTVMPGVEAKGMDGYLGYHSLRNDAFVGPDGEAEVQFITITWFETEEQITQFVGDDSKVSHVPDVARKVLKRWDERVEHYRQVTSPSFCGDPVRTTSPKEHRG
ncbi:MAG: antibiotic biosynthesis monooxygenase [Planctomycetota bacterium]